MSAAVQTVETGAAKEPTRVATPEANPVAKRNGAQPKVDPAMVAQMEADNLNLLGQVSWLMSASPQHKHLFLADLEWRIRPPLLLRQCRMFRRQNRPFAFVTWAYVSDEVAGRLQAEPGRLQPSDWRSGKRAVIVDVIAPFGGAQECVREAMRAATKPAGNTAEKPGPSPT